MNYLEGIVSRWLDRGFGFIGVDGQDNDVFVHNSELNGAFELRAGQRVEFEVEDSPRGQRAVGVKILE